MATPADVFRLQADVTSVPRRLPSAGSATYADSISQAISLASKGESASYDLVSDAPVAVSLGGLTGVNVLVVRTSSAAATARVLVKITHADGTAQVIPVDSLLAVAGLVGYESGPAFNKAFKRAQGVGPGAYRRAPRRAN